MATDTASAALTKQAHPAMSDEEFDRLHGGRDFLPIEQAIYESEGAERFARVHGHGRKFTAQAENWRAAQEGASHEQ